MTESNTTAPRTPFSLITTLSLTSFSPQYLVPAGCIIAEKLLLGSAYLAHWLAQRLAPLPLQGVQQPGLWLGVLAAGALLALTVRLRRYSDDS